MAIIVMKFGGTSVADLDRIRNVAQHVKREVDAGHRCAVVVSAMAGTTNHLVELTRDASPLHDAREYDAIVASGEQVSAGLLAIVLQTIGIQARSWQGWQIPIQTDEAHSAARINTIAAEELLSRLGRGEVAVVCGFQGIGPNNRITTLGRGGSDTSAVALAAALKADMCDIYTDVDGVYTTDPRIVSKAHRMDRISYEEMLEMASLGAKVLQTRSVEMAMRHGVRLRVRSSFEDPAACAPFSADGNTSVGTIVCDEDEIVEQHVVSGITYARDEARVVLSDVTDKPGVASAIFGPLADQGINVDMIVQSVSQDGARTNMTFTVPATQLERAMATLQERRDDIGYAKLDGATDVVKVSIIGVGMRSHPGVAAAMFRALSDKGINIQAISTSEIKLSVLIDEAYTELAVRTLHSLYGLDAA